MRPTYEPSDIEARWYGVWEESGAFRPEINPGGEPFSIVLPPPNVTGALHIGHALNMAIQDVIIRRKRMQGFAALWLPGSDHAGIATQNVVERELAVEGLSRHDLGRDAFIDRVWKWKAESGGTISTQMRKLGFSADWSRERFTLDEGLSHAVREVFVTLYEQGLIYRGNRIINWCPRCQTALSEIEVDHVDEPGNLVEIVYPFVDGPLADGTVGITVATTRVETMLGDTAVAVHPTDTRYTDAVGRMVEIPLVGRHIPVVADEGVDPAFGTGAVKVTPAHDPLDFEIGERHQLEPIQIIDTAGVITAEGGSFAGLDRFAARTAVREQLTAGGHLAGIADHPHSVGHCSRCQTIVEPLLSLQWFVRVRPLVEPAMEAVASDASRFVPKRWEKNYFHWMENLRDWCISRQLWWGHRIPAWYCDVCDLVTVARDDVESCPTCDGPVRAEEDVLDTWFSSALWPFSTLGWPDETDDLSRFYPTSVLVTGFDIIYFWVARMMMMGLHFMEREPFADIVIHGLVRAADGRKMSKSAGNVVDPLELIGQYGADALRLALLQSAAPGQDVPLNVEWVDAARRFGNKLWNAVRFAVEHAGVTGVPAEGGYPEDPGPEDAWVLSRLASVAVDYEAMLDDYRFSDAVGLLYNFAWSEVFDWYLEMAKPGLRNDSRRTTTQQTLGVVLRDVLAMFHPVVPFITEELWSELGDGSLLISGTWPTPPKEPAPLGMPELIEVVTGLRRFRADHRLDRRRLEVLLDDPAGIATDWWTAQLAGLGGADIIGTSAPDDVAGYTRVDAGGVAVFVALSGMVDAEAERPRLEKAIAEAEIDLAKTTAKLANPDFLGRAPEPVVAKERAKSDEFRTALDKLRAQLVALG